MFDKDKLIKYFSGRFNPQNVANPMPEDNKPVKSEFTPVKGYSPLPRGLTPGMVPPRNTDRQIRSDITPVKGQTRPTHGQTQPIPRELSPGVAPTPYEQEIPNSAYYQMEHLDRMWSALTPEEKQGLFGGLMSGKVKLPNQMRSNEVLQPFRMGIERSGYIPSWYRERFNVVQQSPVEPLIPRS